MKMIIQCAMWHVLIHQNHFVILMTITNKCHKILMVDSWHELHLYSKTRAQLSTMSFVHYYNSLPNLYPSKGNSTQMEFIFTNLHVESPIVFKPLQNPIHNGMSLSTATCWLSLWFQMHYRHDIFSIMVTYIIMPLDIVMYLIEIIIFNLMMWPHRNFYCNFLSIWENPIIDMAISSHANDLFEITCGLYHLC